MIIDTDSYWCLSIMAIQKPVFRPFLIMKPMKRQLYAWCLCRIYLMYILPGALEMETNLRLFQFLYHICVVDKGRTAWFLFYVNG